MINYSNRTYTFSINHNRSVLLQWILMHYLICKEAQYRFSVSMAEHISVYMNMYNMAVFEGWLAMSLLICMRNQIWSSYSLTNRWIASPENESNYICMKHPTSAEMTNKWDWISETYISCWYKIKFWENALIFINL